MSGRYTGSWRINTLVLPSMNRFRGLYYYYSGIQMTGRFTGEEYFIHPFSPLWKPKPRIYAFWRFVHFWWFALSGAPGDDELYHRSGVTPILYIYSLRHFLTTKGALIDGDGYPPKSDQNDPKKVTKMMKNWSKMMSKKCQKVWFLMWKSSFWLKLTTIN